MHTIQTGNNSGQTLPRSISEYKMAQNAVKAKAKELGFKCSGQIYGSGRHDTCRLSRLFNADKQCVGKAGAAPSGFWWIEVNGQEVASGKEIARS